MRSNCELFNISDAIKKIEIDIVNENDKRINARTHARRQAYDFFNNKLSIAYESLNEKLLNINPSSRGLENTGWFLSHFKISKECDSCEFFLNIASKISKITGLNRISFIICHGSNDDYLLISSMDENIIFKEEELDKLDCFVYQSICKLNKVG